MTTSRLSLRAAIATVLGLALLISGVLYVFIGLSQRYEEAHSALTVREGAPPASVDEYTYYSFTAGEGVTVTENLDDILIDISDVLLRDAERNGTFTVPESTVYVSDSSLVAVVGEVPGYRSFGIGLYFRPWTPHAFMIPAFAGGLITFAGIFWLAARWHVTASIPHREIDETVQ